MMVGSVLVVELRFNWDILVFMNLKIISWNVRGLNDSRKRLIVKNLLREWKCDVGEFVELPFCGLGGFRCCPDSRWDSADVG